MDLVNLRFVGIEGGQRAGGAEPLERACARGVAAEEAQGARRADVERRHMASLISAFIRISLCLFSVLYRIVFAGFFACSRAAPPPPPTLPCTCDPTLTPYA